MDDSFPEMYMDCPYCDSTGTLMGDHEAFFECDTNKSHIYSLHECDRVYDGASKEYNTKVSIFLGWATPPQDDYSEPEDDEYMPDFIRKLSTFDPKYNHNKWERKP